jgi:hypothetical protein
VKFRIVAACAAFVAVASVIAWWSIANGQSVHLLTGIPEGGEDCHLLPHEGRLVVDPNYGTAVFDDWQGPASSPVPMSWRPGFTGRRVGSEVEVVDPTGRIAATTGRRITYYPGGSVVAGVKSVWNCDLWEGYPATPSPNK